MDETSVEMSGDDVSEGTVLAFVVVLTNGQQHIIEAPAMEFAVIGAQNRWAMSVRTVSLLGRVELRVFAHESTEPGVCPAGVTH